MVSLVWFGLISFQDIKVWIFVIHSNCHTIFFNLLPILPHQPYFPGFVITLLSILQRQTECQNCVFLKFLKKATAGCAFSQITHPAVPYNGPASRAKPRLIYFNLSFFKPLSASVAGTILMANPPPRAMNMSSLSFDVTIPFLMIYFSGFVW